MVIHYWQAWALAVFNFVTGYSVCYFGRPRQTVIRKIVLGYSPKKKGRSIVKVEPGVLKPKRDNGPHRGVKSYEDFTR